jgi:glycosyltransferase involved in cell wall biosynthesis
MKILQITNKVPYPDNDGGTIACLNMAKGFHSLGHTVTILAMNTLKHHIKLTDIPESIKKTAQFILVDVPAPVTLAGALKNLLFSKLPYNAERFISNGFEAELIKILSFEEYDIIQLEGLYVCQYIGTIRKYSQAQIAYRAHNIESEIWERSLALASGIKKIYLKILLERLRKFEISFLNAYDLLVPITQRDALAFEKMGNQRPVFVSQTGIDSKDIRTDFSSIEFPSLFYIGALDWAPNQEGLIWFVENCWERLSERFPDLKFYIAGRNAPRWLETKINRANVIFLGEIKDAHQYIHSKAIMVVPLFSGSGMRIKIIEGMSLGKTIVTTPVGTEGISTTHAKNIWVAETPSDFINTIGNLIENKILCEKTGMNAIRYIQEHFDNDVLASELDGFYKKQLGWGL